MSELEKTERKVSRMEAEYQDLVIRIDYLKLNKQRIKKDIEFYKTVINKLTFIYDLNAE